jgi:hypothetical protein
VGDHETARLHAVVDEVGDAPAAPAHDEVVEQATIGVILG